MYFYDWTYILVIPGLLLGLWAQFRVQSAFSKYSKIRTSKGVPANQIVKEMLRQNGNGGVRVEHVGGNLTDHFDPKTDVLRLSDDVYQSDSIAALGVAAHEAGHAMQKREQYPLLTFRSKIVPVVNIGSTMAWPIFLLGLIFSVQPLQFAGIVLFSLVLLFTLITLPVELDASKRALLMLTNGNFISQEEAQGVRKVLSAAAMTYVASVVSSALQLLRLILIAKRHDD